MTSTTSYTRLIAASKPSELRRLRRQQRRRLHWLGRARAELLRLQACDAAHEALTDLGLRLLAEADVR